MKKTVTIIIWSIALCALLIAAYTFYSKYKVQSVLPPSLQTNTSQQNSTSQEEKIMAPDFTLKDLDGKSVALSDYKGKIVIINFWGGLV